MTISTIVKIKNYLSRIPDKENVLLILCAASLFLPFSLCLGAFLIAFLYALRKHRYDITKAFLPSHYGWFYAFVILSAAICVIYRHWFGVCVFELVFLLFLFCFYAQTLMTDKLRHDIIEALAVGSIVSAAVAFLQKIPDVMYRSVSLFANANYYAYACEIIIITLVYAIYKFGPRPLYFAAIITNLGGILASGCRSAWLSILVGTIVVMICCKKYKHLLVLLGAAIAIGFAVYALPHIFFPRFMEFSSDKSLRFLIWQTAFDLFKSRPLFGHGIFSYYVLSSGRSHDIHAHNMILDVLVNYGVVGTALITVFLVLFIRDLIRGLRENQAPAIALGVMTATFIHGFTDIPFLGLQTGPLLMLIISLAGRWGARRAKKPQENVSKPVEQN